MSKTLLRLWVAFFLVWTLFVLYPNPARLLISLVRIARPPLDAEAVAPLAGRLYPDPRSIEIYILATFPYQYDWVTYGVPWYYPSVSEALSRQTGDCKTRFVVLASIYEALDIPYRQVFSFSHYWVAYDGKQETALEADHNAWLIRDDSGGRIQLPREDWQQIWDNFVSAFWDPMPPFRKSLLLSGLPLSGLLARQYTRKTRSRHAKDSISA